MVNLGKPENVLVYFDNIHVYGGDMGKPPGMSFDLPADIDFDKDTLINDFGHVTGGD
jgi:hypothetical protein